MRRNRAAVLPGARVTVALAVRLSPRGSGTAALNSEGKSAVSICEGAIHALFGTTPAAGYGER